MDGKIKAPTAVGRMWLVGLAFLALLHSPGMALDGNSQANSICETPARPRTRRMVWHGRARR